MKLSRKILGLAVLNLALLAALAAAFAITQFRPGPESLLLGPAHDRVEAIANSLGTDLAGTPASQRDELLASYGRRYRAQVWVAEPRGEVLAGPKVALSRDVLEHMRRVMPPPAQQGAPPPRRDPPPPRDRERRKDGGPPDGDGRRGFGRRGGDRPPPPPGSKDGPPRNNLPPESVFLVLKGGSEGYWAGARIALPQDAWEGRRFAVVLLRSESIFNGALFFDWWLWLAVPLAVVLVTVLCWLPFVRGLTRSIAEMDRVTAQIAQGRFEAQVASGRGDELGHLGAQINSMAARLQGFVKNQKRFLGDIAHELCAPIARVQFALGILEQKAEDAQRAHVAALHEEVQEMSGLVNELLSFSKAGLTTDGVPLGTVAVDTLAERAVARESASGATFEVSVPEGLRAVANEAYLLRALSNVLRNAVRYAGSAGPISVTAERDGGQVSIAVADRGPGLPESELEQVFAPFYRPEESRTRETGGAGLGLAIVRTCVEACKGTVVCRNRKPSGLEVVIRLEGR